MVQYWIQTPIENALEVVQRFMADPNHALSGYQGTEITYEPPTEVVFYTDDLATFQFNGEYLYYGDFYFASDENGFQCYVSDGASYVYTFDTVAGQVKAGKYSGIIWNNCYSSIGHAIFAGYRFKIAYPEQKQTIIRLYNPADTNFYGDIGTFGTSQDDTPVTLVDGAGDKTTWSIYQTPNGSPAHIEIWNLACTPGWFEVKCDTAVNYADFTYAGSLDYFDIELINCQELLYLDIMQFTQTPIDSINRIIKQLDNAGKSYGYLAINSVYQSQGLDITSINSLIAKNWTVLY